MHYLLYLIALSFLFSAEAKILTVDFDKSMGIENKPRYNMMLRDENAEEELQFFRELWNENNPSNKNITNNKKIPKILHQIWIGPKPLPKLYKKYQSVCKALHPDWEFKFWTNKEVEAFEFDHKDLFNKTKNVQSQSDILRYEILKKYGGVYLDIDVLCLEPLDELTEKYSFFAGLEPPMSYPRPIISNAHIGTYPENKLFDKIILIMAKDQPTLDSPPNNKKMIPFTDAFLMERQLHKDSVIFPSTYFTPIFPSPTRLNYSFQDNVKIYFKSAEDKPIFFSIKPESITHHEFND